MAKTKKDYKVSGLSISRDGNKYKASWKVNSTPKKYMDYLDVDSKRDRAGKTDKWASEHAKRSTGSTGEALKFDRSDYYPCTSTKLNSISVRVRGKKKGAKGYWGWEPKTYDFKIPAKPSISLAVNDIGDELTATVKADEGAGHSERYDTEVEWGYRCCISGKTKGWTKLKKNETSRSTEFAKSSGDLSGGAGKNVNQLADADWVQVRCRARSRGLKGNGDWTTWAKYMFGQPARPALSPPKLTSTQVIIPVTIKGTTIGSGDDKANAHPVDSVQLYRYIGTSRAGSADDWTEVEGATDDGDCTGLHDARAAAEPTETGQHVWYMVKAVHGTYSVYSEPVECTALYKRADTSSGSKAYIVSAANNADGDSATVVCGWEDDPAAKYDTTVVSWSTDQEAWRSTDAPDSYEMDDVTWQESGTVAHNGKVLNHASVKVTGLDDGKRWWFRARRTSSSNDQKGAWSEAVPCDISSTPSQPTLTAPATVQRGKGFSVSWAAGSSRQSAWRLLCLDSIAVTGTAHEVVLMGGDGAAASVSVPDGDARLAGIGSAQLAIEVSTGGDYVRSDAVAVAFADPPTATVTCERKVTAAGHAVTVAVQPSGSTVSVSMISASSVSAALPDGSDAQAAGDVVWSEKGLTPGTDGVLSLAVPDSVHLIAGARYRIAATPECGGLTGAAAEPVFDYSETDSQGGATTGTTNELYVEWAHQATAPEECSISLDSLGRVIVYPTKPDGAAETDMWSLYRDTPDGFAEIASGVAFGTYVLDAWPPFASDGECGYRVATFTADGDCDYADFGYVSTSDALRIDWPEGSVTLDGNLSISDSYSKAFEARTFLDQAAQSGTWAPGIERTCSVDWEGDREEYEVDGTVESLRALARYSGSCFVRFPDGCAYEADVQVDSLEVSDDEGEASVSLDITEVELTSYMGKEVTADGLDSTV